MNLSVIYRACGSETTGEKRKFRPEWFSKAACFNSAHSNFKGLDFHIVWDGPKNELFDQIKGIGESSGVVIHDIDLKSNQGSLIYCYDLAKELNSDFTYFIEDDWLHLPESLNVLIGGIIAFSANHFVTLYDRPHGYLNPTGDITYGKEYLFYAGNMHWRSAESCMLTFGIGQSLLNDCFKELKHFCLAGDGAPLDRPMFRHFYSKGIRLFNPIPGHSTHCVDCDLAFGIDWKMVNDEYLIR